MDDRSSALQQRRTDAEPRDGALAAPRWTPHRDEAEAWRQRVTEELRPLVERLQRLRDRGLLE